MRQLKFELDRQSLEKKLTFMRPVLEYANVVWDNWTHCENKKESEKIQN